MALRKGLTIAFLLLILVLAIKIFSNPSAPDIGTPSIIAPSQPSPQETPMTIEPTGGLREKSLVVPENWKSNRFEDRILEVPEGFTISVYASGLESARFMAIDDNGDIYLSQTKKGKISVLRDLNGDGVADEALEYAEGLNLPHGLAFDGDWLYVAENDKVVRLIDEDGDHLADRKETVVDNLPGQGGHFTRTIGFGPEGKMYVSVGSSCNVCEDEPRRAAILRFNKDGSGEETYAEGLRNSVGFVWNPDTREIWATDNGRDWLGDDLPPDEINVVKGGNHYGWPYCYGQRIPDPEYDDPGFCTNTEPPTVELQAHSAPLGLRFYDGNMFPGEYRGDLFVAFHGSWNRNKPTGYKVVRIKLNEEEPVVEDFITGWLINGDKWGRPVDIIVGKDGAMYISDDFAGAIYRVSYSSG
ncbi:MAG: sorbosone dehydrogenase family protein [Desulfatiglandales bacterium]